MASVYADNVVFLMRPGETARRRGERLPGKRPLPSGDAATVRRLTVPAAGPVASPGYRHTVPAHPAGQVPVRQRAASHAPLRWVLLLVAACILPAAVCTWRAVVYQATLQHYTTAAGEQRTLPLSDGATAQLAAQTAVSLSPDRRSELLLQRGRVEIALGATTPSPFAVRAGDGAVSASDGRFQVSRAGHRVNVLALAGTVQVNLPASSQQVTLRAGQQVDYGYDRLGEVRPAVTR